MAAPRRLGAKAQKREIARANLRLDAEAYRRLLVYSVMEGRAAGDIVTSLIQAHLKGWSMPGKISPRADASDRLEMGGVVSESVASAA